MKIDLRAAFQAKNPGLARWIPSWLFKILERLIHQDEINAFLAEFGHLRDLPFAREVLRYFGVKVAVRGLEHLPTQGAFVLVANHPLGGLDGLAMYDVMGQVRDRFASLSNDIMMQVRPLEGLFIPVNKHGSQSRDHLKILHDKIAAGYGIIVFPSGLVSTTERGNPRFGVEKNGRHLGTQTQITRDTPLHRRTSIGAFLSNLYLAQTIGHPCQYRDAILAGRNVPPAR